MQKVKKSISRRLTMIVILGVCLSCIVSIGVSILYYTQRVKQSCEDIALIVSRQAAGYVDGNLVSSFLEKGESSPEYTATEKNLNVLLENSPTIQYLFVYAIYEDGVHVVFDLDTPELEGDELGTVLTGEQGVSSEFLQYQHGEDIPIEYSNGEYGKILTVYTKIFDSDGKVAAYAGVDIDMASYYQEIYTFAVKVILIICAIALLIFIFVIRYINRHITRPIQIIVHQTEQLKSMRPDQWIDSEEWKNQVTFHTEDEFAMLNDTVIQLEESASMNTKRLIETEHKLHVTKELAQMNSKLEAAVKKAEEANRAKSDFLAQMSHDMRTPLNGILGSVHLAMMEDDSVQLQEHLHDIQFSGQFLLTLINDVLDMSKIESGKMELHPEPYAYSEFISNMTKMIEPQCKTKHITLNMNPMKDSATVLVDKLRFQQIFFNIFSNAVKYTPEGGTIDHYTEVLALDENHIDCKCHVIDNGIGMSEEFQKHIFEAYTRENQQPGAVQGTGLGITIANYLAHMMGGELQIQSELGKGTEVIIHTVLELVDEPERVSDADSEKLNYHELTGKRILLAEDHPLNAKIATKLLEKESVEVVHAKNGKEALCVFEDSKEGYFDLILMDVRMPVMDGIEATKRIRALDRADAKLVPIIAMTANAYAEDIKAVMNAGMNAHLAKPVEPQLLYETLAAYV